MYNCRNIAGHVGEGLNDTKLAETNVNLLTPHSIRQHASKCGQNVLAGWRNGVGVLCVMGHAALGKEVNMYTQLCVQTHSDMCQEERKMTTF